MTNQEAELAKKLRDAQLFAEGVWANYKMARDDLHRVLENKKLRQRIAILKEAGRKRKAFYKKELAETVSTCATLAQTSAYQQEAFITERKALHSTLMAKDRLLYDLAEENQQLREALAQTRGMELQESPLVASLGEGE